ncbi:MAG: XTP/dITP diphosphatase [Oscillospiraceae bacterium]|nr:XTP/dITP diphosphatase [Oscillospiraceae bacterium]MBP1571205.1 XTP/dITP diphosphatase [Oscillospiraceae bacterium]MBQ5325468.1 XTP/dITP diphosphatase [Oscillospiraceae bacterium]
MVFAVATNNQKKLKEIQRILDSFGITAKTLKELGIAVEIEENGTTFEENAVIKAKTIAQMANLPTISDDSGLEVDALSGAPGVYTARFAGENATDDENIDKLLHEMKDVEKNDRTARFVSAVCLYMPDGRHTVCRGTCEGWIGYERIGDGGFGYDPVFMVNEISYSQMSPEAKDAISHRGSALRQLKDKIEQFI